MEFILYVATARSILKNHIKSDTRQWGTLCLTTVLFVLATVILGSHIDLCIRGIIDRGPRIPGGIPAFFTFLLGRDPGYLIMITASMLTMWFQDGFLVRNRLVRLSNDHSLFQKLYRCLIIWRKRTIIIFPVLLYLGCIGILDMPSIYR